MVHHKNGGHDQNVYHDKNYITINVTLLFILDLKTDIYYIVLFPTPFY